MTGSQIPTVVSNVVSSGHSHPELGAIGSGGGTGYHSQVRPRANTPCDALISVLSLSTQNSKEGAISKWYATAGDGPLPNSASSYQPY